MRRECSACGTGELEVFLDLGTSPIADAYTSTPTEKSERYPLQVATCSKCRLAQLLEVVPDELLFGAGYSFYSSSSPPVVEYHAAYARDVLARFADRAARGVVEIACNDGDLLRHFGDYPAVGIDPAMGPAEAARARGLEVLIRPFGLQAAHDIRDHRGRQGLVFANHVLAHVADVADVLAGIRALLADDGVAMVEVQYLPDMLVNNAFDLVYHEHRQFFSLSSLEQAALRHGLHIADAELTDRQGGSLRVTLTTRHRPNKRVDEIRASERWLDSFAAYDGMQGRAERIRTRINDLLATHGPVVGYAAPAKATTLLNFCALTAETISYVADPATEKQGRYIPGTGIQIMAPPERLDGTWLLLAWNYARQIIRSNPAPRWIVPFPAPVQL